MEGRYGYQNFLLVYDLESLLSQSADQDISPRIFEIGMPDFYNLSRICVNKTSISTVMERMNALKFITLDFWNSENKSDQDMKVLPEIGRKA